MSGLLDQMRNLGRPKALPVAERETRVHHSKKALRAWRVVLDKLCTLLAFTQMQQVVEEWFPLSQPSHVFPQDSEPESQREVYQILIQHAKVLKPLQSKVPPRVSASSCIHPASELKGGGNATSSYIVCQMCYTRWEAPVRASVIRQELKGEARGGRLKPQKQKESVVKKGAPTGNVATEPLPTPTEESALKTEYQRLWQELERQRTATRESELRQEKLMQAILRQKAESECEKESSASSWAVVGPGRLERLCNCGKPMERMQVKKDGPRKGRHFLRCEQRICEAFEWDQEEIAALQEAMSVQSVASTAAPQRKVPRTTETVVIEEEDDHL